MKIRETTIPAPRRFEITLLGEELWEITIALDHVLSMPHYCADRRALVSNMLDKFRETLGPGADGGVNEQNDH